MHNLDFYFPSVFYFILWFSLTYGFTGLSHEKREKGEREMWFHCIENRSFEALNFDFLLLSNRIDSIQLRIRVTYVQYKHRYIHTYIHEEKDERKATRQTPNARRPQLKAAKGS